MKFKTKPLYIELWNVYVKASVTKPTSFNDVRLHACEDEFVKTTN